MNPKLQRMLQCLLLLLALGPFLALALAAVLRSQGLSLLTLLLLRKQKDSVRMVADLVGAPIASIASRLPPSGYTCLGSHAEREQMRKRLFDTRRRSRFDVEEFLLLFLCRFFARRDSPALRFLFL